MKLKNAKILMIVNILIGFSFGGCNDGFMERFPETDITNENFFSTPEDLETYTNGFYDYLESSYRDIGTDNLIYLEECTLYSMMRNEITEKNIGSWSSSWERIRNVNYFLVNANRVEGNENDINHYVGIARLFRAYLYYGLVKTYSDVPWYSRPLETTDEELLYKPQDSRELVVDSIMADLDFAVKNIKEDNSKTRFNKWSALAIQARIALHEGTFRKYHTELNLSDGDDFLRVAKEASWNIIQNAGFSISTETTEGCGPYESLFGNPNLTQNPEMIMIIDYDKTLRTHESKRVFNFNSGLSRSLVEDYLYIKDGKTVPFQQIEGYDKIGYLDIADNRDPRLSQTLMMPGYIQPGLTTVERAKLEIGSYPQKKFYPLIFDGLDYPFTYMDLPFIRYAEVLLIYAETRAELGELTQADLDATVNLLRRRVDMPFMNLNDILSNIDPIQSERYSNVSGPQKGAILEVRRERRIELACEGFRYDDLFRWKVAHLVAENMEGAYIDKLGLIDVTGDGNPDYAVVATQDDADEISQELKDQYNLTTYILEKEVFYLTEGDHGFIGILSQKDRFKFEDPRYYYYPIYEQDMIVNPNLKQNNFWKQ